MHKQMHKHERKQQKQRIIRTEINRDDTIKSINVQVASAEAIFKALSDPGIIRLSGLPSSSAATGFSYAKLIVGRSRRNKPWTVFLRYNVVKGTLTVPKYLLSLLSLTEFFCRKSFSF
jgi:hypothetical protein